MRPEDVHWQDGRGVPSRVLKMLTNLVSFQGREADLIQYSYPYCTQTCQHP